MNKKNVSSNNPPDRPNLDGKLAQIKELVTKAFTLTMNNNCNWHATQTLEFRSAAALMSGLTSKQFSKTWAYLSHMETVGVARAQGNDREAIQKLFTKAVRIADKAFEEVVAWRKWHRIRLERGEADRVGAQIPS